MTGYFELTEEKPTVTIQEFVAKHRITSAFEPTESNPNMEQDEWAKKANHYLVTLSRPSKQTTAGEKCEWLGTCSWNVPYSMGKAHKDDPTAADVLSSLALDAAGVHGGRGFEDWAQEYGYDTDSRKAEKTFHIVCKQARELQRFLGDEAYQELLFEVEAD